VPPVKSLPAAAAADARLTRARGLSRWLPAVETLRTYDRRWIARDLAAGLALCAILVPAGMAYAQAAGLPAVLGLYSTIASLLAYAAFGPSRILVLGPDSALAAMIGAALLPLAAGDPARAAALAGALAIVSGTLCALLGCARLAFVAELISTPIRYGYLNGIALTVMLGQLPTILGFPAGGTSVMQDARALLDGIVQGRLNPVSCALGAACLLLMIVLKRSAPRAPGVLLAVIAATLATSLFDLPARAQVAIVGMLPGGMPAPGLPRVSLGDVAALLAGGAAIALVSVADTSVLSRVFAQRSGRAVDADQELVALGIANAASGLFHGFPVSSSTTRTAVAEAAGARSQLAGVAGAACIALLIVAVPTALADLPRAALSAAVIFAAASFVELRNVLRLYRLRPSEFALSVLCLMGVSLLGVIPGIFIAVGISLLAFVWRAWRPYDAVLGRVPGVEGYHDRSRHPEALRIPGLVLFRWDAPLFFANAEIFREHVLQAIADAPRPTRWVVVAAEPVTDIDVTAADVLIGLDRELHEADIDLLFAEMKGPVKDRLKRYGLFTTLGAESFFPTVEQAVDRYLATHETARAG
jgi:high affinity sulfate transporter 1